MIQILIGNAMTAAAFGAVIVPRGFASGGTTGLSMIIAEIFSYSLSKTVLAISMVLFLAGLLFAGRRFAMKTALCVFTFPYMLSFFQQFELFPSLPDAAAAVLAGVLLGCGTAIILCSDASSGGFDVVGVIISRKTGIPAWAVLYGIDAVLIGRQILTGSLSGGILGIMVTCTACLVSALVSARNRTSVLHAVS